MKYFYIKQFKKKKKNILNTILKRTRSEKKNFLNEN